MTPEQLERLKARRDEIITVAMGRCWHISTDGYYCDKCGAYILDEDSINFTPRPDYSTPEGWFKLYNWLTKEKPEWWEDFYWWSWRYWIKLYNIEHINSENHNFTVYLISNLSDLFVQWLAETETGWHEERSYFYTPLGKLMKEMLDENKSIK